MVMFNSFLLNYQRVSITGRDFGYPKLLDSPLGLHPAARRQQSDGLEGRACATRCVARYRKDEPHHMHLRSSTNVCNSSNIKI